MKEGFLKSLKIWVRSNHPSFRIETHGDLGILVTSLESWVDCGESSANHPKFSYFQGNDIL